MQAYNFVLCCRCIFLTPEARPSRPSPSNQAHLSEETRVVLVKHDTVVVLTTSVTATTRVLPVLADTTMASTDVAPLLPALRWERQHTRRGGVLSLLLQIAVRRVRAGAGSCVQCGKATTNERRSPAQLQHVHNSLCAHLCFLRPVDSNNNKQNNKHKHKAAQQTV